MPIAIDKNNSTPNLTGSLPKLGMVNSYKGMESGLSDEILEHKPSEPVISTAEIGRMFTLDYGTLALFNPCVEVTEEGQTTLPPILSSLTNLHPELRVGNFGCGGASDIPLLYQLLTEALSQENKPVKIENFDLSEEVVRRVKDGTHPQFDGLRDHRFNDFRGRRDERIFERVLQSRDQFFEPWPELQDSDSNEGTIYRMRPEALKDLHIETGDVCSIPRDDGFYSVVLCYNVIPYLTAKRDWLAFHEIERVLADGGVFLTEGAIFKKIGPKLTLISGCESRCSIKREDDGTFDKGLYPTFFDGEKMHIYSIRTFTGYSGDGYPKVHPGVTFIGSDIKPEDRSYDF